MPPHACAAQLMKKRSNSARKPPEPNSIKRKNSKVKENSNSRANQQRCANDGTPEPMRHHQHQQSTFTLASEKHNFSTIVRVNEHEESSEDVGAQPVAPQASKETALSSQFSIFEQQKLSVESSNHGASTQSSVNRLLPKNSSRTAATSHLPQNLKNP